VVEPSDAHAVQAHLGLNATPLVAVIVVMVVVVVAVVVVRAPEHLAAVLTLSRTELTTSSERSRQQRHLVWRLLC